MRRALALGVVAVALAAVGLAAAKGPDRARVCGATCRTISGDGNVYPLLGTWASGAFSQVDPPRAAPYYTFRIDSTRGETGRWLLVWVPSKRLVRITQAAVPPYQLETVGPYWRPAPRAARAAFAAAVSGLRAHKPVARWRVGKP